MSLVLEALPSIAAEVAAPLAKTDEIVLIGGGNNTTNEINKLVGTLPPAVQVLCSESWPFCLQDNSPLFSKTIEKY